MFLIERLIGVGIYSLLLAVICVLIAFTGIKCKALLAIYAVILAVMAFFYEPYTTADLYRIIHTMKVYGSMSFSGFASEFLLTSSSPLPRIVYWILGKIGAYHLVSSISALICYGLFFRIMTSVAEKYSISRANIALTLIFLMSSSIYISVVGGIRMMVAISLIAFCFFRETVENKRGFLNYLWYVCAALTHNIAFVVIAIRIFVAFFSSKKRIASKIKMFVIFSAVFASVAVIFNSFFVGILDKVAYYLFEESYSDVWEYIIGVLLLCFFVVLCISFRRIKHKGFDEVIPITTGAVLGSVIAVAFVNIFSFFYRLIGHIVPILAIPTLMITLEYSEEKEGRFKKLSFQSIVLVFSILILALSISRGSLSSLKFFAFEG